MKIIISTLVQIYQDKNIQAFLHKIISYKNNKKIMVENVCIAEKQENTILNFYIGSLNVTE